jgi:flagellin-like hook-associated protein FlgL
MKEKIELFVNKMPKFSGNLDAENEVDDYVGSNFDKMSKELNIDLNDEKATDDAWNYYSELLNNRMNTLPGEDINIEDAIAKFVTAMPPYTGDKESEEAINNYASEAFIEMAKTLGIDLNDDETADNAWQQFNKELDKKLEQDGSDLTSTGSTEKELEKATDSTDATQKNILAALTNHRF